MKYDDEKAQLQLIPSHALNEAAKIFAFGAAKYGENNWRRDISKYGWTRHYGSIQRHLTAWIDGEDNDRESGMSHLSHAMTQMMILLQVVKDAPQCDNRFKSDDSITISLTPTYGQESFYAYTDDNMNNQYSFDFDSIKDLSVTFTTDSENNSER